MKKSLLINRAGSMLLRAMMVALLLAAQSLAPARGGEGMLEVSPQWREALAPLQAMPVQDYGFVRSGYTFGENHLSAITGKNKLGKTSGMEACVLLMADPARAQSLPLLKVSFPDLVKLFGAARISLKTYRDEHNHHELVRLVRSDQEKWLKPINELEYKARLLEDMEAEFAILPRAAGEWGTARTPRAELSGSDEAILGHWAALKQAVREDNPERGAAAAKALAEAVETAALGEMDGQIPNLALDVFYHRHAPFKKAAFWYVLASLAYLGSFLINKPKLAWAGYGLMAVGFVEHSLGTAMRWILSGRAPLSDMFESFTFAVGGMVLVALVFEAMNRTRLVGLGSAVLGFIFMVLAHQAPIFDSQIRPLMPALQSSWLTYHVVTIMLSYSAFALAAFVAVVYLAKDLVFKGDASKNVLVKRLPTLDAMDVFTYRIIAVGFPLLTLGIVVGAVWAATAWGRPWGFDPKETWSAITWLVYAIYLHVRYLAGWKGRRAAILAIVGFLAVLFTYFGVNYLLPGLHSYV